jgi:Zn finger protein HypA/HybF involved in hydrogenase expression
MKSKKEYAKAYYQAHRETILKRAKMLYKPRHSGKCKGCGEDIKELQEANNGHFMYCNKCMADKEKVSRQARWYRKNRFRLQFIRKMQRQNKSEGKK